jgi:hypothetical protein
MSDSYSILAKITLTLHSVHGSDPDGRKCAIGLIRNGIFDCPSIFTGLVSEKGQHLKSSQLVKEHFHPRQASAYKMFEMLDAGATVDELVVFLKKVCQVNYVTKEENEALKPYQKIGSGYDTWEEQYEAVGIKLVQYVRKTARKYMYIIDGIVYKGAKDAMRAHTCSLAVLNNRCIKDKRGNYTDWKRELYND